MYDNINGIYIGARIVISYSELFNHFENYCAEHLGFNNDFESIFDNWQDCDYIIYNEFLDEIYIGAFYMRVDDDEKPFGVHIFEQDIERQNRLRNNLKIPMDFVKYLELIGVELDTGTFFLHYST